MNDWKEYKLGELATFYNGRAYKNGEFKTSGTPIVRIQNLTGEGKTVYSDLQLDENKYIENGDLIYAWSATFGPYIWRGEKSIYHYHIWKIVCNEKIIDKFYFYYKLKLISDSLKDNGNGSIFVHITKSFMENFKIKIPSLEKQKYISNILSNLDKKIRFNTQINQTLEQIAQALFKSWFVDFDPVRAKVQALSDGMSLEQAELAAMQAISGKTPEELTALSQTQPDRYAELAETAKVFPCEIVEVDGIEVPRGWEIKPLPEIIDFLEGPGIRNWQYTDEEDGIKFINIRCIQNGDLTLTTANKITKEEAFGKYKHFQLEEDDIVVSTSGTLGRFAFVRKEHLPLSLNTSVIRFRPIKNKSTLGFIAGFVENQLQHELEIRASGSAQRNFGPTHLKQISLLVPDFKLLELHQKYASSLFEKRKQLLSEIDVLKDTRDLLLPKLLNGEI